MKTAPSAPEVLACRRLTLAGVGVLSVAGRQASTKPLPVVHTKVGCLLWVSDLLESKDKLAHVLARAAEGVDTALCQQ